jgi:serine phosphatase RsbU (regulator of sigma subunit)
MTLQNYNPERELQNFLRIVGGMTPGAASMPRMENIDIYGGSVPLYADPSGGTASGGGDHIIYVDFKNDFDLDARIRRAKSQGRDDVAAKLQGLGEKSGILLTDVSGHNMTDAALAGMLHAAFKVGMSYSLDTRGEVSTGLFERINSVFYDLLRGNKYLTMIYGEISEDGTFRFISAAHPPPVVFSREYGMIMDIGAERLVTFPPLGTMPSQMFIDSERVKPVSPLGIKARYEVNNMRLEMPDTLVMLTDGLTEHVSLVSHQSSESHEEREVEFFPFGLEESLRKTKDGSAEETYHQIMHDAFMLSRPQDDVSCVVIKKRQ